jgi:hypothetical protein
LYLFAGFGLAFGLLEFVFLADGWRMVGLGTFANLLVFGHTVGGKFATTTTARHQVLLDISTLG